MSASDSNSAVFLSDTQAQIKNKINKHAFSGGQATIELHRNLGGNPDVDIAFQYLRFFLESDDELLDIENKYRSGELSSGELKKTCIALISGIVLQFQKVTLQLRT